MWVLTVLGSTASHRAKSRQIYSLKYMLHVSYSYVRVIFLVCWGAAEASRRLYIPCRTEFVWSNQSHRFDPRGVYGRWKNFDLLTYCHLIRLPDGLSGAAVKDRRSDRGVGSQSDTRGCTLEREEASFFLFTLINMSGMWNKRNKCSIACSGCSGSSSVSTLLIPR